MSAFSRSTRVQCRCAFSVAIVMLLGLSAACAGPSVAGVLKSENVPSPSRGRLSLVAVYGSPDDLFDEDDPGIRKYLDRYYTYTKIDIGYSYNEADDRHVWATRYPNVSYEDYLKLRTGAYTDRELDIIKAFSIRNTPAYFILDKSGAIIDRYTGPTDPLRNDDFSRRFVTFLSRNSNR